MEMTEQQIVLTLATKVMGWKRYEETDFWYGDNGNLFDSALWNPLQNIADAWQVVEQLKLSLNVRIETHSSGWYVELENDVILPISAEAKTVPEAICNAALKLVA